MITLFLALPGGAWGPNVSHSGWSAPSSHERLDITQSPSFHVNKQVMFRGEEGSGGTGRDADLVVNVLDMVIYRLL